MRPVHLLELEPELMLVHFSHGSRWLRPVKLDGSVHRLPESPWRLTETEWRMDSLWFVLAERPFSIHTMRILPEDELRGWYINVQQPASLGQDGFNYMDRTLDVVVSPDLSTWQWKDEDELEHAQTIGLYDDHDVKTIREAAEDGLAFLREHVAWMGPLQQRHSVPRGALDVPPDP